MKSEYNILDGLSQEQKKRIFELSHRRTYDRGSFIIKDGAEADCFYIIQKGDVAIMKNGITLATIKPGMHFGLMALIDGSKRSADALAATNTTLDIIPFDYINSSANTDIYQRILNNQLVMQQNQLRLMNDFTVAEVQKKSVPIDEVSSLSERVYYESLLKEIHHRVKNNLQMVSSMLYLQSRHIEDADAKEAILSSQRRVESMALIHKNLYQRENLAQLEMKSYITQLAQSLIDVYKKQGQNTDILIEMEDVVLNIEKAIPIGIIINELITNSLKYAFDGKEDNKITIKLANEQDNKYRLKVADNGIGKSSVGIGFGTQLIKILVNQIEGKMTESNVEGYRFDLEF